jgi:hypothetical protein
MQDALLLHAPANKGVDTLINQFELYIKIKESPSLQTAQDRLILSPISIIPILSQ